MDASDSLLYKLEHTPIADFPNHTNYSARYITIAEYLDEHVHPFVNQAAMLIDGGFLTDHGPNHIKTVIQRASELTRGYSLTPYETYLLLVAIQFHDSGHIINGRKLHEKNAVEVMKGLNLLLGADAVEKKQIRRIVDAHGGKVAGSMSDKDKIGRLESTVLLLNVHIRVQFIAAILRFADELADDSRRAARYLLKGGGVLPIGSEVFHAYALALHSVYVEQRAKEVELAFSISRNDAVRKFSKSVIIDGKEQIAEVYLLDEVFDRTLKMYTECVYCMRFFPTELQINSVKVKIEITDDDGLEDIHQPIGYRLRQTGYPSLNAGSLAEMCGNELLIDGQILTGELLSRRLT